MVLIINKINMENLDIKELKALAYDNLALIEQCQSNLKIINTEIAKRLAPEETTNEQVEDKVDAKE